MIVTILRMTFSASIFILVIVVLRALFLYKIPKKTFLILWDIVLFCLLVPLSIPSRFSIYTQINHLKNTFVVQETISELTNFPVNTTSIHPQIVSAASISLSSILLIWISGFTAFALFLILTHLRCCKEYKMSLPVKNDFILKWQQYHQIMRTVQIRESDKISTPLTYGIWKPIILLPKNTDYTNTQQLDYILTHEFTHIRHFDTLIKWLLVTALCVHWFNPLVWIMYMLANKDIELSCDETVVQSFGETMKSTYALTLINIEETRSNFYPLCNNFNKNSIKERIKSIMKMKKTTKLSFGLALVLVASTTVLFATSALASNEATSINVVTDRKSNIQTVDIHYTQQELLDMYNQYGISFDQNGKMLFNGKLIRYFWDGVDLEEGSSASYYDYFNKTGTVDVHTIRTTINNGDGSIDPFGDLTNIVAYSQKEFDERDLSSFKKEPGIEATAIFDNSLAISSKGETFAEKFSKYIDYGITYKEVKNSSIGNVYYNNQLIKTFIDEGKNGIFTFQSKDGNGKINVYAVYNKSGKLIGVEKN